MESLVEVIIPIVELACSSADLSCSRTNRKCSSFAMKHFQRKSLKIGESDLLTIAIWNSICISTYTYNRIKGEWHS